MYKFKINDTVMIKLIKPYWICSGKIGTITILRKLGNKHVAFVKLSGGDSRYFFLESLILANSMNRRDYATITKK